MELDLVILKFNIDMQRAKNSLLKRNKEGKTRSVGYQATFSRQCGTRARIHK